MTTSRRCRILKKKLFCLISLCLTLALFCIQTQVFAETVNQSVKECLDNPDSCSDKASDTETDQTNKDKQADVSGAANTVGLTIWDFLKMILATIFVVTLLYFVLKLVTKKGTIHNKSETIVNLGGLTVGTNRSVQLIKVGERLLVVGVGENIQLLSQIEKGQEYDHIITDYNKRLDQMVQPSDILSRLLDQVQRKKGVKEDEPSAFQILLKKQLDELSNGRKSILEDLQSEKDNDKS